MAAISGPPDWGSNYPVREFDDGEKRSWALYSRCENYRYRLRREWGKGDSVCFLMLNPSTASEEKNDPTVERCERRARRMGFGGFEVVNIFALRSTNPKGLYESPDPIGEKNDIAIQQSIQNCQMTIIAWGTHGAHLNRGEMVLKELSNYRLYHLGMTKAGHPKHPLYISYDVEPMLLNL